MIQPRLARGVIIWLTLLSSLVQAPITVLAAPRQAQVAGQFYPAEKEELRALVSRFLALDAGVTLSAKPRALIVPHAGYPYSGPIAAQAFRQIKGHRYDAVVVVAFTHRLQFPGASVDDREAYETPLGTIPVDLEAVKFLLAQHPRIAHYEPAHTAGEHSLEVMLPFLQVALGDFKLVPILMGTAALGDAEVLAEALSKLAAHGDYLFIFSTDLSHYHPYQQAQALDNTTVNAMMYETPQAVRRLFDAGEGEAGGRGPILTALTFAGKRGYLKREFLAYANSGDTAGDKSRVVGYSAIALLDAAPAPADTLSPEAGKALVTAARRSIERHLAGGADQRGGEAPETDLGRFPELSRSGGIFVTLKQGKRLRGCIGRIQSADPLATSCPLVAIDAATHDPRFQPVTAEELKGLTLEVSVLSAPRPISDPKEIVAGRDGIILEHQGHGGVFLPQVWDESGWTRIEFLRELASQKAGLPPEAWQQAHLYVFQDQVFEEETAQR